MPEWNPDEIRIVVDEYVAMLEAELRGQPYAKLDHNRRVQDATGRTKGSIEFKFANISAVLADLQLPWVLGYKPRSNYQRALRVEIERRQRSGAFDSLEEVGNSSRPHPDSRGPITSVEQPTEGYPARLARLRERAFGGSDVAVRPNTTAGSFWPTGRGAPASDEAITWLRARLDGRGESAMVFLVGGPGNGKSTWRRERRRGSGRRVTRPAGSWLSGPTGTPLLLATRSWS